MEQSDKNVNYLLNIYFFKCEIGDYRVYVNIYNLLSRVS